MILSHLMCKSQWRGRLQNCIFLWTLLVEEKGAETFFEGMLKEQQRNGRRWIWHQAVFDASKFNFSNDMHKTWLHFFFLCILEFSDGSHPIFSVPAAGIYVVNTLYICEGSSTADFFLQDSELKWMQTFPDFIRLYFCNRIFILGSSGIFRPDAEDEETREGKHMALLNEWLCVMKLVLNETEKF